VRVSEKVTILVSRGIENIAEEFICFKRIVSERQCTSSTVEVNGIVVEMGVMDKTDQIDEIMEENEIVWKEFVLAKEEDTTRG
jgi:hypothetical protein